jgi:PCFT/HCP family folate transporter-like MFS transporter 1/3
MNYFDIGKIYYTNKFSAKFETDVRLGSVSFNLMLYFFLFAGEMAVMYLFTRYRFNWNEVDFSLFSTYGMITNLFGKL